MMIMTFTIISIFISINHIFIIRNCSIIVGKVSSFEYVFEGTTSKPEDFILAFYACYYCYTGV